MQLLEPFQSKHLSLRNRVVMAPLTRCRAANPELKPTEIHATYYRQRASAGLIITEASPIMPRGIGYINTPGIYSKAQIEGWKGVTAAVHEEGGVIFQQLWHVGRISHPDFHKGELPHAPSAINPNMKAFTPEGFKPTVTPKAMTVAEIKETIRAYAQGALNSLEAGFDGVEIHSSNGYLVQQFFESCSNHRTDEYGGSIENKARFFFEILDTMKEMGVPLGQVGCRFNPCAHEILGITMSEDSIAVFEYVIQRLNDYGLAYMHLSEPFKDVSHIPYALKSVAGHFRPMYNGVLMTNKGYTRESGNAIIESGLADLVAYGKPYIGNPDLVERFENNWPLSKDNRKTYYTPGIKGYIDYPPYQQDA